jgi:sigma-B regulation protein RsbU (phosphoserine phosphatase)
VLDRDSGELVYVNAGHNPPIVWRAGRTNFLEATGTALGLFDDTAYDVGRTTIPPDGGLLIYTDGLPDSIPGNSPEDRLYRALDNDLPARCPTSRRWWIPDTTRTTSPCCW